MAAGTDKNGMPKKMLSPAKMKTFSDCTKLKDKMEADMQSGALTPAAYAKTLVRAYCPKAPRALSLPLGNERMLVVLRLVALSAGAADGAGRKANRGAALPQEG